MFDRYRLNRPFRYSRWDGTQRLDDLEAEDILDALSDDYLKHGDLRRALERMMREGFMSRNGMRQMGMQDLLDRLKQRRQQRMERYNLSSVMDDIKERLERIKQMERDGIQRRLDEQLGQRAPGQQQQGDESEAGQPQAGEQGDQTGDQAGDQPGQRSGQSGQRSQSRTIRAIRAAGFGRRSA